MYVIQACYTVNYKIYKMQNYLLITGFYVKRKYNRIDNGW